MERRASPPVHPRVGQVPLDKTKVLQTNLPVIQKRSRITREAHDPAKPKDPYPIHSGG